MPEPLGNAGLAWQFGMHVRHHDSIVDPIADSITTLGPECERLSTVLVLHSQTSPSQSPFLGHHSDGVEPAPTNHDHPLQRAPTSTRRSEKRSMIPYQKQSMIPYHYPDTG